MYNVGNLARDASTWITTPGNKNPVEVIKVLDAMRVTTDALLEEYQKSLLVKASPRAAAVIADLWNRRELNDQLARDLWRWDERLTYYMDAANDATDGEDILASVIRPVFYGWHDPDAMPEDVYDAGYPDGFDFDIQHTLDATTPFIIANQMRVKTAFDSEVWSLTTLWNDIKDSAEDVAEGAVTLAVNLAVPAMIVGAAILGAVVIAKASDR